MKIGVIADTHGYLDPRVPALFQGVEHILHAGDIGLPYLILQLEEIAPVTAVLGNVDTGLSFKDTELVELGGCKFLLQHVVDPYAPTPALQRRLIRDNPAAVIFGHTHKPFAKTINGVLYFNPGYAGKARFGLPGSIAILESNGSSLNSEFKSLE